MEVPVKLNITPYDYQREGIEKGLQWKRLFLGDEPGLGKSQPLDSVIMTPNGEKLWVTLGLTTKYLVRTERYTM